MMSAAKPHDQLTNGITLAAFLLMALTPILIAGCTEREKVLDIETPGGGIEVYEETDNPNSIIE